MSALDYHRTIFGYHGCDQSVADRVLSGGDFRASENDYDWLGKGIYFWEYGPRRAIDWAKEEHTRKPHKVIKPASVGAVLHLGRCFDLLDTRYTDYLASVFPTYHKSVKAEGLPLPTNEGRRNQAGDLLLRRLDCAVLNWAIEQFEKDVGTPFQTVRGVFVEGDEAFPGSCIMRQSHIQVAVRDPDCIIGLFVPKA